MNSLTLHRRLENSLALLASLVECVFMLLGLPSLVSFLPCLFMFTLRHLLHNLESLYKLLHVVSYTPWETVIRAVLLL